MTVFAFSHDDPENPLFRTSADEVSRLPFGAAELDRSGRVVSYNDTEPGDGATAPSDTVGRDFFADVVGLETTSRVTREFHRGVEDGQLNVVFDCAVAQMPYKVRIHLKVSPILGTFWVFVKKLARHAT